MEKGGELAHGYTYSGHPVCTAVALENIRILAGRGDRREHPRQTPVPTWPSAGRNSASTPWLARRGSWAWSARWSWCRTSRAGRISRTAARSARCAATIALANGLILRATNDAMLLSPPLIITREQIDEMFAKAWKSLDQTAAALGMGGAAA